MSDDLAELLPVFQAQALEGLDGIEEGLVQLESQPEGDETLREVFRLVHTLKGDALSLGFEPLAGLAHAVEDLLDALRDKRVGVTPARVSLLLRASDGLRTLLAGVAEGGHEPLAGQLSLVEELEQEARARDDVAPAATDEAVAPEAPAGTLGGQRSRTLRVDVERLDHLLTLTGEIAVSRGRLTQLLESEGTRTRDLVEFQRETERLYLDLQELVMKLRMVPVGPTFQLFARTVRDVAHAQGKQARLQVVGGDVEVDNSVLQLLRDPLSHMVRNAVGHGIETPAERERAGKAAAGSIVLHAYHDAGNIVIEVVDDGAGLDRDAILRRAHERGLLGTDERPADAELDRMIFEPGFSTSRAVTGVSGRGVGMDVVRRNIEALRGSVGVESSPGRGTTLRVRLPLTLAIIEGLFVEVADDEYVIPIDAVLETVELPAGVRERPDGRGVLDLRGESLPFVRLRRRFGAGGEAPVRENVVVVQHEAGRAGLVVDSIQGQGQTVIKPLAKIFQGIPGISASAILGNGRVALIMDVPGLLRPEFAGAGDSGARQRLGTC